MRRFLTKFKIVHVYLISRISSSLCVSLPLNFILEQINIFFFPLLFKKIIYLLLATLGLSCCARAFSSCCERRLLFLAVCVVVTSLVAVWALKAGPPLPHDMWNLCRVGIEPVSFEFADRFLTIGPPFLSSLNISGPGVGNGYPLQYSCLENYMDGGA